MFPTPDFVVFTGGHGNNLIAVLAKYIYHKHDPALPRLAIQLLKRLATVMLLTPHVENSFIKGLKNLVLM